MLGAAKATARAPGAERERHRALYDIKAETDADYWEVEALYDLAFAPGREALSSYRLRDAVPPVVELCHIARDADHILAGAIRYWPVQIGAHQALLLGPIAVHPTRQGEGLGALLMQSSLEDARALGHPRVLLVGDAAYYGRLGFAQLNGVEMPPPTNPARVLGINLTPNAWEGVEGTVKRVATS